MSLVRAGLPLLILLAVSFNSQATCIVKSQKITLSPETVTNRNNHALGSVLKKVHLLCSFHRLLSVMSLLNLARTYLVERRR